MRHDLLLNELAITLGSLGREPMHAVKPLAKILGNGDPHRLDQHTPIRFAQEAGEFTLCILALAADRDKRVKRLPEAGSTPTSNLSRQDDLPRRVMLPLTAVFLCAFC